MRTRLFLCAFVDMLRLPLETSACASMKRTPHFYLGWRSSFGVPQRIAIKTTLKRSYSVWLPRPSGSRSRRNGTNDENQP
jgi:hypothetical protein